MGSVVPFRGLDPKPSPQPSSASLPCLVSIWTSCVGRGGSGFQRVEVRASRAFLAGKHLAGFSLCCGVKPFCIPLSGVGREELLLLK